MECLVVVGNPIAEIFGTPECLIAMGVSGSSCLVAILVIFVAVVVGGAVLMAWLKPNPLSQRQTVAERLERSAGVVTPQVNRMQAQDSAIRKDAQNQADQVVTQAIKDLENIIKTEVDV